MSYVFCPSAKVFVSGEYYMDALAIFLALHIMSQKLSGLHNAGKDLSLFGD